MKIFQRYALSFDGNDYVVVLNDSSINLTSSFTITLWFKPNTNSGFTTLKDLIDKRSNGFLSGGVGYSLAQYNDKIQFGLGNSSGYQWVVANNFVDKINEWYFLAAVVDANNMQVKMYKNGELFVTAACNYLPEPNTVDLTIGKSSFALSEYFNGTIDEVRIYIRALSPEKINILYNGGHVTEGLVAWYPMVEGSGNIVADKSGNGNDGTIYGATWVDGKDVDMLRQRLGKVVLVKQI